MTGSRGMVFTMDSAMALTMALAIACVSYQWLEADGRQGDMEAVSMAFDVGLALDKSGALSSTNASIIEAVLGQARPDGRKIGLQVERYRHINGTLHLIGVGAYGDSIAGDRVTQKVLSTDGGDDYILARITVATRSITTG